MMHWEDVLLLGADAETEIGCYRTARELTREEIVRALAQFRREGAIHGYFMAPTAEQERHARESGEGLPDACNWGPLRAEIDWTGFPGAKEIG